VCADGRLAVTTPRRNDRSPAGSRPGRRRGGSGGKVPVVGAHDGFWQVRQVEEEEEVPGLAELTGVVKGLREPSRVGCAEDGQPVHDLGVVHRGGPRDDAIVRGRSQLGRPAAKGRDSGRILDGNGTQVPRVAAGIGRHRPDVLWLLGVHPDPVGCALLAGARLDRPSAENACQGPGEREFRWFICG
jgi:hypothetical protein